MLFHCNNGGGEALTTPLKLTCASAILVNMVEISPTFWSVWSSLIAEASVLFSLLVTVAMLALDITTCQELSMCVIITQ